MILNTGWNSAGRHTSMAPVGQGSSCEMKRREHRRAGARGRRWRTGMREMDWRENAPFVDSQPSARRLL